MPKNSRISFRPIAIAAVAMASAAALIVGSAPAQAVRAPQAAPAALDTCRNPGNSFVSLEVAPEITGQVPIGAGYHRLWDMAVAWKDINPSPGVFNWNVLDQRVAQAAASGAIPMLVLGLTPQWAAADPNAGDPRWGAGTASPPADFNTYRSYVDAVVSRYGGRIGAYEVWNEANLTTFWTGTPEQMAQMTKIAYDTIKAKNPGAVVTSASVTTRLRSPMAKFMTPYVKALIAQGNPIDAFAIHTYPAGNAGPPERVSDIRNWQNVVATAAGAGAAILDKQVWDTEVNYGLAGPGPTPPTDYTDAQGADLISQTFADSLTLGIDATFWYLYTASPFDLLGVQLWSGTPVSINAWNAARAKYNGGANLCPSGTGGGTSTGPGGSTTAAKSITITGGRNGNKIVIDGTSTGLPGSPFDVYLKIGKGKYKKLGSGTIAADGTVHFERGTTKARPVHGYIQVSDVKSNTVPFPRS